jgi:phage tail-like protein
MPEREDPITAFHFALDIGGVITGYFSECSGIGSEHEVIEAKQSNAKGQEVIVKVPGRLKWENITLKRGISSNLDLWNWRQQVIDVGVEDARKDGSIVLYDQNLVEVARWEFSRAWPVKIGVPQLESGSNQILVEELTIAHEFIRRVR